MAFLRNLLALIGLAVVAAVAFVWFTYGSQLRGFDEKALATYRDMAAILLETGNAAEATVWKVPVDAGATPEGVEEAMNFAANEHNFKNVGELPLSDQIQAMTGQPAQFMKIYLYCDPLVAARMVAYSDAYSAYLPCRITLLQDEDGKYWLVTLNMDLMIHGGKTLPPELREEALKVKAIIQDIMKRGATGEPF
jgi:uncharacterized protein (DUF302 family)